jgi:excisionase family DNA binding protein
MNPESHESALLLSVPRAALALGVGVRVVRAAIEADQIHSVEIGRRRLISRREIERLTESQQNG